MTDGKSTKEAVSLKIYESAEDYLEKILMLTERNGEVRSIDIATEMGVTKPSVSIAMKNLRQAGYISMDGAGYITLEPPGLEIATRIYGRHKKLTRFFVALGVDPVVASHDACKIEHDISDETFAAIKRHVKARQAERESAKAE